MKSTCRIEIHFQTGVASRRVYSRLRVDTSCTFECLFRNDSKMVRRCSIALQRLSYFYSCVFQSRVFQACIFCHTFSNPAFFVSRFQSFHFVPRGGATVVKVGGTISRAERAKIFFDPPPRLWLTWGGHETGYCSFLYRNYDV